MNYGKYIMTDGRGILDNYQLKPMVKYYSPGLKILTTIAIACSPTISSATPNPTQIVAAQQNLASLNAALHQNPQDIDSYIQRGILNTKLDRNSTAIADYTTAIGLDPNNALAYNNRAVSKLNLQDYWGAYQDYSQVLRIHPDRAITHNNRAVVRQKLGDCKGAIADLRIAAELFRQQGDQLNYQRTLANLKFFQRKR